jgi:hypothetical protein
MHRIGLIALAIAASVLAYSSRMASTRMAFAQSGPSYQALPLGDVWITAQAPKPLVPGAIEATASARQDMPTGDVWPTGM